MRPGLLGRRFAVAIDHPLTGPTLLLVHHLVHVTAAGGNQRLACGECSSTRAIRKVDSHRATMPACRRAAGPQRQRASPARLAAITRSRCAAALRSWGAAYRGPPLAGRRSTLRVPGSGVAVQRIRRDGTPAPPASARTAAGRHSRVRQRRPRSTPPAPPTAPPCCPRRPAGDR